MHLVSDLRFSLRLLRKTPSFTAITLVILVLGLSLYITSYAIEQIMSDKPMPFPDGERYVSIKTIYNRDTRDVGQTNHNSFSYFHLKENSNSFSSLNAFTFSDYVLSDGDYARSFRGANVEWGLIETTTIQPILGRVFDEEDSTSNSSAVALISESIWRSYYNSDPDVIGRTSRIDGEPVTVIGVMPSEFRFPFSEDIWMPLTVDQTTEPSNELPLSLVGVLSPGVTADVASIEIDELMNQLEARFPDIYRERLEYVTAFASINQDRALNIGRMMSFMTLIILGLASINLSSLLLIRARTRQQELAIRSSVGASGSDLAKQVLLESFLVCLFGLVISVAISFVLVGLLNNLITNSLGLQPFWFEAELNGTGIAVGAGLATVVWLTSGLPIAIRAYKSHAATMLDSSSKGGTSQGRSVFTRLIVFVEMILCFFLLVCCAAVLYAARQITTLETIVDTEEYVVAGFDLDHPDYADTNAKLSYIEALSSNVKDVPGTLNTTIATAPPGVFGQLNDYQLADKDIATDERLPRTFSIWVDDGYFQTLGITLLEGREFSGDTAEMIPVTVISENLASSLWPNESSLGKQLGISTSNSSQAAVEWLTVVGVVPWFQQAYMNTRSTPNIYRPLNQNTPQDFFLITRNESGLPLAAFEEQLRIAAGNVDRNIALDEFQVLDNQIRLNQGGIELIGQIFAVISVAAFALAGIGIYGVIARSIALQTNEIGIRRALGSADLRIVLRYLRQGFTFLSVGTLLGGSAATIAIMNVLSSDTPISELVQVLPVIVVIVTVLMGTLITTACYLPARKAIALEPGDALRYE